jgi:cell division protein FtsX
MLLIGLLLLGATGAFTALAIAGNLSGGPEYTVSVLDHQIATMNTLAVFSSGLALALIFCLALTTAVIGASHRPTHRRHRRLRTHGVGETTHVDDMMGPDQRA